MDDSVKQLLDLAASTFEPRTLDQRSILDRAQGRRSSHLPALVVGLVSGAAALVLIFTMLGPLGPKSPKDPAAGAAAQESEAVAYPRGAFETCPTTEDVAMSPGDAADSPESVAMRVNDGVLRGDDATIRPLVDASVSTDMLGHLPTTATADDVVVEAAGSAADNPLVDFGCGPEVAAHSWQVTLSDSTGTASAGAATFFLIPRGEGWQVWGSY